MLRCATAGTTYFVVSNALVGAMTAICNGGGVLKVSARTMAQEGSADLVLLGWTGVNGDPDSFLCPLFCGAEGAFNTAFVPMFAGARAQHGDDHAREIVAYIDGVVDVVERQRAPQTTTRAPGADPAVDQ